MQVGPVCGGTIKNFVKKLEVDVLPLKKLHNVVRQNLENVLGLASLE